MSNKEPIKRHPAIVSFSKDHHFGLLLAWKIRQGLTKNISAERISDYVLYFFKEDLEKHFADEEEMLFSNLPFDDEMRMKAESDHREIFNLVNRVGQNKQDNALLNELADKIDQHIRFEERELFNHLQDNISTDKLEEIAKRMPNSGKEIDEHWKDIFWEIKK